MTREDQLLVIMEVDVDEREPISGSDVLEVLLAEPDPERTPRGWPARDLVEDLLARRRRAAS